MSDFATASSGIPLETLGEKGTVPETRFKDAAAVSDLVSILKQANDKRNSTDAKCAGLIAGNPPYKSADLKNAGQSWRANVNFREAEAFVCTAQSAFYDVLTEAPTMARLSLSSAHRTINRACRGSRPRSSTC